MRVELEAALGRRRADFAVLHSDLLRAWRVVDGRDVTERIVDLAVDLSVGDYPVVEAVVLPGGPGLPGPLKPRRVLPWDAVERVDARRRRISVKDLDAAEPVTPDEAREEVWLRRDIADSLVLDLTNIVATRCNGVWLRGDPDRLWVAAADVSVWALLHRLTLGRVPLRRLRNLIDWKYVEFLRGDPRAAAAGRDYHRRVTALRPAQIARLTDALPYLHAAELLTLIPDQVAADTLEVMTPERQVQVFEEIDEAAGRRLLALMAPDAAADLIGRLEPDTAQRCLEALPPVERGRVVELLRYPEDTVGGIMTNDVVTVTDDLTVGEARETLRERLREPDFVYYVYVVDDDGSGRLTGVVTLRDLLVEEPDRRVGAVQTPATVVVDPLDRADRVAERIAETHLNALPVVAADGRLLGAVTVDAALAQIAPEAWRRRAPRVFS